MTKRQNDEVPKNSRFFRRKQRCQNVIISFRKQSGFCVKLTWNVLIAPPCKTAGSTNAAHQWYGLDERWAGATLSAREFLQSRGDGRRSQTGVAQFFRGPKQQSEECRMIRWRACRPERGRGRRTRPETAAARVALQVQF